MNFVTTKRRSLFSRVVTKKDRQNTEGQLLWFGRGVIQACAGTGESLAPIKVFISRRLWLRLVLGHEQWKSGNYQTDAKTGVPRFQDYNVATWRHLSFSLNVWGILATLGVSLRSGVGKSLHLCPYTASSNGSRECKRNVYGDDEIYVVMTSDVKLYQRQYHDWSGT